MEIYDANGKYQCRMVNPLNSLIGRSPAGSLYHMEPRDPDADLDAIMFLEIAADTRQKSAITESGDSIIRELERIAPDYDLAGHLPGDAREPDAQAPPATFRRLFPSSLPGASFQMNAEQGGRQAVWLMLKERDWEYFLPIRALAQSYCPGDSWSLLHMMLDYLGIAQAFELAEMPRVISPDYVWVDTRNSQLVYLGSALQYSSDTVLDLYDVRRQNLLTAHHLFYDWRRLNNEEPNTVTKRCLDAMICERHTRLEYYQVCQEISAEVNRDGGRRRAFAYYDDNHELVSEPLISRSLYYGGKR